MLKPKMLSGRTSFRTRFTQVLVLLVLLFHCLQILSTCYVPCPLLGAALVTQSPNIIKKIVLQTLVPGSTVFPLPGPQALHNSQDTRAERE